MKRAAAVVVSAVTLALLLTGCPSPSAIGGPCESSGECQSGLSCATNFTGGYCFKSCTGQGHAVCGTGNVCVRFTGESTSECYEACSGSVECRSGYECKTVSNLPNSYRGICLPK
jgi:serine protease